MPDIRVWSGSGKSVDRGRGQRQGIYMKRLLMGTAVSMLAAMLALAPVASGASATHGTKATKKKTGVELARKVILQWEKPPKWQGPTKAIDVKSAKGKVVDLINLTEEIPALHQWAAVAQAQLEKLGVTANICDAKGTATGITTCMTQGVAAHPNVIVAMALTTTFIHSYITQANSAGIKVITAQTGTPGLPKKTGAVAEVTFDYPQVGQLLGAWYAAQSKCKGSPQIITSTSSRQPSAAEVKGIKAAVKKYCPSLRMLPVQNSLIPTWTTQLPTLTRSDLTAHSGLDYLLPLYDGMTIPMVPAIQQLHLGRKVQIGSFNATPVVMQNELAKSSPLSADVGGPNAWYGYALADETLRVLVGAPVVANERIPLRLFTRANIGKINVHATTGTWYGPANYACHYDKLWGQPC